MPAASVLIILRMYVLGNTSTVLKSRKLAAHHIASIAIWNRNKVAVAVAISVCVINAVFFILG